LKKQLHIISEQWNKSQSLFKATVILFLGLFICYQASIEQVVGENYEYFPGDFEDGRFNTYILEHDHQWFMGEVDSYWSAPFMYPETEVITYSDNLLGAAPFYSMFRVIGYDRENSFQLWYVTMQLFCFIAAYWFLWWCFKNPYAAAIGAMIFTISIAMQSQMGHAQVFPRFPVPLTIWFCLLFQQQKKAIYFVLASTLLIYQFYCGIYLGFFLLIPYSVILLSIVVIDYKAFYQLIQQRKWLLTILIGSLLNLLLFLPLILPYLERSKDVAPKAYEDVINTVPTVKSFFFSHGNSYAWKSLEEVGIKYDAFWDHQIFPGGMAMLSLIGFFILVTVLWVLKKWKKKEIVLPIFIVPVTIMMAATFVLFIRYQGHSLYYLVFQVPGFDSMRSITRIINIELLFFGFAAAFLLSRLLKRIAFLSIPIFIILSYFVVLDNQISDEGIHRRLVSEGKDRIDPLIEKMKHLDPGTVVSIEIDSLVDPAARYQLDAMMASQYLHLKCINGYSAVAPDFFDVYWREPNEKSRLFWLNLRGINPDEVVVVRF
jgi:hypothetical protein